MSQTSEVPSSNGSTIKVGTTGTIGSLMTRELESMKQTPKVSTSSRKQLQATPISVPCASTPKILHQRKSPPMESSSSNSSNGNTHHRSPRDAQKLKGNGNTHHRSPRDAQKLKGNPRRRGPRVPMLGSEDITVDRNPNSDKLNKKGRVYIVEVVDVKCSNPMSNRLKKVGFSKLSESTS